MTKFILGKYLNVVYEAILAAVVSFVGLPIVAALCVAMYRFLLWSFGSTTEVAAWFEMSGILAVTAGLMYLLIGVLESE